jgi:hypothetical protein
MTTDLWAHDHEVTQTAKAAAGDVSLSSGWGQGGKGTGGKETREKEKKD